MSRAIDSKQSENAIPTRNVVMIILFKIPCWFQQDIRAVQFICSVSSIVVIPQLALDTRKLALAKPSTGQKSCYAVLF